MVNPTSSLDQFKLQPWKIQERVVYHYIKSNIDGSYPAHIFIRVNDQNNLDVWKFEQHNIDAAHVQSHIDWETFSADLLKSWVVTSDGNHRQQAKMTLSRADASLKVQLGGRADTIQIKHYPIHIYNFDLISLNFSLRHWIKPESEVIIGIVYPNFLLNTKNLLNQGTVTLRYIGNEQRQGQFCRKYTLEGHRLLHHKGIIWVNHLSEHIEDMEILIPDNPAWDNFKMKLISFMIVDEQTWRKLIKSKIKKLKPVEK